MSKETTADDEPCTDCEDTGWTIQTERRCSCAAGLALVAPPDDEPQTAEQVARSIRLDMQVASIDPHNQAWINDRVAKIVELANGR